MITESSDVEIKGNSRVQGFKRIQTILLVISLDFQCITIKLSFNRTSTMKRKIK